MAVSLPLEKVEREKRDKFFEEVAVEVVVDDPLYVGDATGGVLGVLVAQEKLCDEIDQE